MPFKLDKVPINNPAYDKRVKLTDEDKRNIIDEYESGSISIHSLSKKYAVSRRLIQFTLFPERKEKAKQLLAERQKEGRYYSKEKHRVYMSDHRHHKKELWNNGVLKENKDEEE